MTPRLRLLGGAGSDRDGRRGCRLGSPRSATSWPVVCRAAGGADISHSSLGRRFDGPFEFGGSGERRRRGRGVPRRLFGRRLSLTSGPPELGALASSGREAGAVAGCCRCRWTGSCLPSRGPTPGRRHCSVDRPTVRLSSTVFYLVCRNFLLLNGVVGVEARKLSAKNGDKVA